MAATESQTRVNFLSDAAHLLREAAPETSAYLMTECADHLLRQGSSVSDIYRQHVCTGCGHIMLPGDSSELKLEARKYSQKKKASRKVVGASLTGPCKTLTCGHCKSITRVNLPPPEKAARSKSWKKIKESTPAPAMNLDKQKPTANAGSKKRAKNRKVGLQALLSSQQKPSGGLSLASFMK